MPPAGCYVKYFSADAGEAELIAASLLLDADAISIFHFRALMPSRCAID